MPETLPVFASMIVSTCVLLKQRKKAALSVSPHARRRTRGSRGRGPGVPGPGTRRLHRAPAARRPAADPNSAQPNKKLPRERQSDSARGLIRGTVESIAMRECSRPRSARRLQTPPLQRRTHRTPGCAPLKRPRHSPARSTCADAFGVRSSPLGADMVGKSRNMSADMLIMPGLLGLMTPTICCVRSQSVRDLVTEISGGATPHRCGVAQSSSSELATQAHPSLPHSRLMMPVHAASRLACCGSRTRQPWPQRVISTLTTDSAPLATRVVPAIAQSHGPAREL